MKSISGSPLAPRSSILHQPFPILLTVVTFLLAACGGGAADNPGTTDSMSLSAPMDAVAPSVTITGPTGNPTHSTSNAAITLSGSASDNVGATQVTWVNSRGGSGTASGTTSWSVSGITLQGGTNTLAVTARDAAGNNTTDTLVVTYTTGTPGDTTAPSITITSPTSGSTYTTTSGALTLAGSAGDNVGVTSVIWSNNRSGSGTAAGTTAWTTGNITLQSGSNVITVTALDAGGNITTDTLTVTYNPPDATAPGVTITGPTSAATYTTTSATLSLGGTAADNVGVTQVTWSNSRGGSGTASGTTSWNTGGITLQSGSNTLTVTVRDAAGNTASDSLTVTYSSGGSGGRATYYLSPTGSDSNTGQSLTSPWKSFSKAFASMAAGDELILLDGTYSEAAGTSYISYLGSKSGQIPSGTGVSNMTYVHALNPGNVTIQGELFVGRSTRKDSYIKVQGITFEGGGALYNTSHVTLKDCGFHGYLGIGSNDHNMGNSYALLEDVWVWGNDRIMLIVYRSDHIVVRRAVVRNDGCYSASADCGSNSGNAMVGTAIYNSNNVSFQNVIAADNVLGPNGHGGAGDFMATWHDNFFFPWHRNEWLGSMSLNTGLGASFLYDIDNLPAAEQPMATYRNIVAVNTPIAFAANMNCGSGCAAHNITVHNGTFRPNNGDDGLWINSNLSNGTIDIKNIVAFGSGGLGVSSPKAPAYTNVNGFSTAYQQTSCSTGCYTSNPTMDGATPSLKYPTRIEDGAFLKGKGLNGDDIGANVMYRYGTDGTFHGDVGYNTLGTTPLWPWPNESRIKSEMCAGTTRGFCSTGQRLGNTGSVTLTTYIWEQLNNPVPAGVYP